MSHRKSPQSSLARVLSILFESAKNPKQQDKNPDETVVSAFDKDVNSKMPMEVLSRLKTQKPNDLYYSALQDDEQAALIAMDPELRKKINVDDWLFLFCLKPKLAEAALSMRSWDIFEKISPGGIVELAKNCPSLIPGVISKFKDGKKLKPEQWAEIVARCKEDGLKILSSEMSDHFKQNDFLNIALSNSLAINVIIKSHMHKLDDTYLDNIIRLIPAEERQQQSEDLIAVIKKSERELPWTIQKDREILQERDNEKTSAHGLFVIK